MMSWSPDSQSLASGSHPNSGAGTQFDYRVLIWKVEPLWNVNGWPDGNELWTPGGGWLSTAFWGEDGNTIKVAMTNYSCMACRSEESGLPLISWSPKSRLWDFHGWQWDDSGDIKGKLGNQSVNLKGLLPNAISPDGEKELFWVTRGMVFPYYSKAGFEEESSFDSEVGSEPTAEQSIAHSGPQEKTDDPNIVLITDHETRESVRLVGPKSSVSTAEWSPPDGTRVLTSSSDGTVRIWDAKSGREMARYAVGVDDFARAIWSPDGKWVLTGYPSINIWPADVDELLNKADALIKAIDGNEGVH